MFGESALTLTVVCTGMAVFNFELLQHLSNMHDIKSLNPGPFLQLLESQTIKRTLSELLQQQELESFAEETPLGNGPTNTYYQILYVVMDVSCLDG